MFSTLVCSIFLEWLNSCKLPRCLWNPCNGSYFSVRFLKQPTLIVCLCLFSVTLIFYDYCKAVKDPCGPEYDDSTCTGSGFMAGFCKHKCATYGPCSNNAECELDKNYKPFCKWVTQQAQANLFRASDSQSSILCNTRKSSWFFFFCLIGLSACLGGFSFSWDFR